MYSRRPNDISSHRSPRYSPKFSYLWSREHPKSLPCDSATSIFQPAFNSQAFTCTLVLVRPPWCYGRLPCRQKSGHTTTNGEAGPTKTSPLGNLRGGGFSPTGRNTERRTFHARKGARSSHIAPRLPSVGAVVNNYCSRTAASSFLHLLQISLCLFLFMHRMCCAIQKDGPHDEHATSTLPRVVINTTGKCHSASGKAVGGT